MDEYEEGALRSVSELVRGLADVVGQVGTPADGMVLTVETVQVQLPVELVVARDAAGALALRAAPPERTETSFRPALHGLRLRIEVEDNA
jgi:hypothetical protein